MKKTFTLTCTALLFFFSSYSQDKIYRNSGKVIEAKILEVGSSEIKYREYHDTAGPIYILETDKIKKVVFENGKTITFEDNLKDPERYAGQLRKAIKFNFLSPLYGYTEFGFEKNLSYGRGYEFSLGIIGAGKAGIIDYYNSQLGDVRKNPFGIFVSGGYKFGKLPDFILFGKTKASHLMQGTYAKPIVYLGAYKENQIIEKANSTYEIGKQNVVFGALQIEVGRQWVFGDKFLLDIYEGFGYGFDNKKDTYQYYNSTPGYYDNEAAFNYANERAGKSPGFSLTFGIKCGLLIK